ncbi:MAG: VTT domain-containing protein [Dehalococcoidia bacterium]|nr:VTT domain-containing protein [Dehalococcoidia bacterium]
MRSIPKKIKPEYVLALAAVIITVGIGFLIVRNFNLVREMGAYGYVGAFVVSVLAGATVVVPIPGLAVIFSLGAVLNPAIVGLVAGLGEAVGSITIYLTGMGGRPLIERRYPKYYPRMVAWLKRKGGFAVFLYSAVFNPFYYPLTLVAGALKFGLWRFFFLSWAGKTVKCLFVAYAGYFGLRWLAHIGS